MDSDTRVLFLRHKGSDFDQNVIGRYLSSEANLVGEVCIESDFKRKLNTLKHEFRRSGPFGLLDALTFRLYYSYKLNNKEENKIEVLIGDFINEYPSQDAPEYIVDNPNSDKMSSILDDLNPDIMVARTKVLLDKSIFSRPSYGTVVIHPGICPEYRNQHGCFWALANGEPNRVGYSLIRIDEGIDTGDILAQDGTPFNPSSDEHIYIQLKVVADNIQQIADCIKGIDTAEPIETKERESGFWGMPKFSAWKTWKRRVSEFDRTYYDSSNDI